MKSSRRIGWALFLVVGLTFGSTLALSQSAVRDIALDARTGARLLPDSSIISGLTPFARYSVKVTGSTTAPMQGLFFMYVDSVAARVRYTAIGDSFCFQPTSGFYQLAPIYLDWVDSADNVGTLTVTVSGPTTGPPKQIDTRRHAIMIRNTYSGLPSQPVTVSVTENPTVGGTAVRGLFSMYQQSSGSAIGFRYLEPGDEFHCTPINATPQLGFIFLDWSTLNDNSGVFRIHTQLRSSTSARQLNARTDARLISGSKIIGGLVPGEIYRVAVSASTSPAPNTPMQGLFFMYVDIDTCMVLYVPSGQSFCFRPGTNPTYQLAPIFLDWSDSTDNQGYFVVTTSGPTFRRDTVYTMRDAIMIRNINHLWSGLSTTRQYAISIAEQPPITGTAVRGLFTMSQMASGFMFRYVEPGAGVVFAPAQSPIQFGAIFLDWSTLLDNSGVFQFYGADTVTDVKTMSVETPSEFRLSQNYPNPFNPSTTIRFALPKTSRATLRIYNSLGQEIATLVAEQLSPGTYTTNWNASGVASGVYFYRLSTTDFVQTRKLLLLR